VSDGLAAESAARAARGRIGSQRFEPQGMQVEVYRQKTRKMDKPVLHYQPNTRLYPVRAAEELIEALAACGRVSGPLFTRVNRHGQPAHPMPRNGVPIGDPSGRMTGQAVAQAIHRCAVAAGLSGRCPATASAAASPPHCGRPAGADREMIERQGGWTPGSRAVSDYIEEAAAWLTDALKGVL
jgi:hypothetical protein